MSSTVRNDDTGAAVQDRAPQRERRRRRLLMALWLIAAGVLVLDQVTKAVALQTLTPYEYVRVLGDIFGLMLVFNPGAAFSFATGSTWIFTIVAIVVTVVIIRVSRRLGSLGWALALGALLGGNLGNLLDRLLREPGFARGHVVDFLDYGGLFVGNVADIAIVLGAVGMALLAFLGIGIDGVRHTQPAEPEPGSAADTSDATDTSDADAAIDREP